MKTYKPKIHWTNKVAIALSFLAVFVCTVNLFLSIEILRTITLMLVIASMGMNFTSVCYQRNKWLDYYHLKYFECQLLKWSYQDMASYINSFKIPELNDLPTRIENELNDIAIRKNEYAMKYYSKYEIQDLKDRNEI